MENYKIQCPRCGMCAILEDNHYYRAKDKAELFDCANCGAISQVRNGNELILIN